MNIITHKTILKAIAKKYNLSFCKAHGYYEGDVYKNDKGESLPNYFSNGASIYKLKYFDGCFKPYLVDITKQFNLKISIAQDSIVNASTEQIRANATKYLEYLKSI